MTVVDFHIHAVPPEVMGEAGTYGPEEVELDERSRLIRVGERTSKLSPRPLDRPYYEMYIEAQDEQGVDVSGLEITPLFYFHWVEPEIAKSFARAANDTLSGYVSHYPKRLFFMATLPMQDIAASVEEAKRAVGDLGARGLVIGTDNMAGRDLDDEALFPLYETAVELDVPIFVHPAPYNIEDQQREDKYNFSWIPGYEFRETLAVCHLIYGGVLDEFPELQVCVPHGGGTVPFLVGKLGRLVGGKGTDLGVTKSVKAQRPFEDYLHSNFYFDTFVEDERTLRFLLEVMTPDRVMFGQHTGLASTSADELTKLMAADLSDVDRAKVLGGNAMRLFKL